MCGLVGTAGNLQHKDEALMKRLLMFDYFRGPDSTGIASIRSGDVVKIAKVASHPLTLFDMEKFKTTNQGFQSQVLIGHNRSATRGAVNDYNAHPYQVGHIVGAHNGTLDHRCYTALETKLEAKFETDSLALFACIAKFGVDETIPLLEGAWSLVWWDMKQKTLNFLRNKERPMWFAWVGGFKQLMWASEWSIIQSAVRQAATNQGHTLHEEATTGHTFWASKIDALYTIPITELMKGSETFPDYEIKVLKGKEPAPVVTHYQGGAPFNRVATFPLSGDGTKKENGHTSGTPSKTTTSLGARDSWKKEAKAVTNIHVFGTNEDPFAGFLDLSRFSNISRLGCAWCRGDVKGTTGLTIIEKDEIVLCTDCSGGPDKHTRIFLDNFDEVV